MSQKRYPTALTIAGSDSGGCAGIQADLKTFASIGVFGTSAITAITAQNTVEVRAIEVLSPILVGQQAEAVLDDIVVDAIKTGMLPTPEIVETVASIIDRYQIKSVIVDPVMVATSGASLTTTSITDAFRSLLFPRLTLLTPNIPEAEVFTQTTIRSKKDMYKAGEVFLSQACKAVLIKGGHLDASEAVDILFQQHKAPIHFSSPLIKSKNTHGTGCTTSSAIASFLALGNDLETAIDLAKKYISLAIDNGKNITTGNGHGPVNHFFAPQKTFVREFSIQFSETNH